MEVNISIDNLINSLILGFASIFAAFWVTRNKRHRSGWRTRKLQKEVVRIIEEENISYYIGNPDNGYDLVLAFNEDNKEPKKILVEIKKWKKAGPTTFLLGKTIEKMKNSIKTKAEKGVEAGIIVAKCKEFNFHINKEDKISVCSINKCAKNKFDKKLKELKEKLNLGNKKLTYNN